MLAFVVTCLPMNVFAGSQYVTRTHVTGYFDDLRLDGDGDGSGYDISASGDEYEIGFVAVHPKKNRRKKEPIWPFGATITIDSSASGSLGDPICTPVGELYTFKVKDLGDYDYRNDYKFFDVYCGRYTELYDFDSDRELERWINKNVPREDRNFKVTW
jgi:hypothetical protein